MGLGIHNNHECVRCGACCVYFSIVGEKKSHGDYFKQMYEVCRFLSYDKGTRTASCSVHEGDRPISCRNFFCNNPELRETEISALKRTAKRMPEYFKN